MRDLDSFLLHFSSLSQRIHSTPLTGFMFTQKEFQFSVAQMENYVEVGSKRQSRKKREGECPFVVKKERRKPEVSFLQP